MMPDASPRPAAATADERPIGVAGSLPYLPELESLRGIAALLVMAFHYDALVQGGRLVHHGQWVSLPYAFVRAGDTGVSLFFILSAFLLSMPFHAAAAGGQPVSVRRYWKRRALRILPLYYSAVAIGAVVHAAALADLARGLPFLLFLNGFGFTVPLSPWSNVWWSLATEMQFYVLLPLLLLGLRGRAGRAVGGALLLGYAVAYVLYEFRMIFVFPSIEANVLIGLSVFGRGPLFLCGIAAAALYLHHGVALRQRLAGSAWLRAGGADLVLAALVVGLAALLRWHTFIGIGLLNIPPAHALRAAEGPFWTAIILWLLLAPLRLKALVHNRLLTRAGVLSYSIFLLHLPVLYYGLFGLRSAGLTIPWGWRPSSTLATAALAALCLTLAALTYRFIEAPFLRRKERLRG